MASKPYTGFLVRRVYKDSSKDEVFFDWNFFIEGREIAASSLRYEKEEDALEAISRVMKFHEVTNSNGDIVNA